MGKGRPTNYDHITYKKKFLLFSKVEKEGQSVKQAAKQLGINYSTAKTIMFLFRTRDKIPTTFLTRDQSSNCRTSEIGYLQYSLKKHPIKIVSTIGGECLVPSSPTSKASHLSQPQ